jgi:hypothetical protein
MSGRTRPCSVAGQNIYRGLMQSYSEDAHNQILHRHDSVAIGFILRIKVIVRDFSNDFVFDKKLDGL